MLQLEGYFDAFTHPRETFLPWRKKAWDRLLQLGMPQQEMEAFQYVPLNQIEIPPPAPAPEDLKPSSPNSLLFSDGYFQGAQVPQSVVCMKLEAAMLVYGIFLQNRIRRGLEEETDPLAAMNGALQGKGAFLYIPPNVHLEHPIEIIHENLSDQMISPHIRICLGKGASARIVQRFSGKGFCNAYVDASLDAGSSLFFADVQNVAETAVLFQSFRSTCKRDAKLHFLSSSNGAFPSRSSIKVQLLEENSEALLQGLHRLDGAAHHHTHVLVEHLSPHSRSRQHFKGILRGSSRSSFEGKILVRPEAQKTEAYQLSNLLLLSEGACGYAKPNLEIFADDVKASHGATIAPVNQEELFYLRSRGASLELAQQMLVKGFSDEILKSAPVQVLL